MADKIAGNNFGVGMRQGQSMRRLLALGLALVALVAAGFFWTRDRPVATATEVAAPPAEIEDDETPLGAPSANVTPEQREMRRFGLVDRHNDHHVSRDEYLSNRKKAFAKLDADGDGRLRFDEYAVSAARKFGKADRDGDRALTGPEFATTAAKYIRNDN